jgi:oxygen-independent coproporphyrinogen-3 oxidase
VLPEVVDTVYLGGGTPSILPADLVHRLFAAIRRAFAVLPNAEITVECAPGQLSDATLAALVESGVNRISFGVQSFVDREAALTGRLHTRAIVLEDVARVRAAGIGNISLDLLAGLPGQTAASWRESLAVLVDTGVHHASVYMLEVDDDSRLGRELIAGGTKYHAHFVPDEDLTASMYETACDRLNAAGLHQYEISNFARPGFESRHNLKYWTRQPYLGFGVDAHSMLTSRDTAVRFSMPDSLEQYVADGSPNPTLIDRQAALEETFFLGLRLNHGLDLDHVRDDFGPHELNPIIEELVQADLLQRHGSVIRLTPRGRLLSNEVFERFLTVSK